MNVQRKSYCKQEIVLNAQRLRENRKYSKCQTNKLEKYFRDKAKENKKKKTKRKPKRKRNVCNCE